jgi:hypothetical protein
MTEENQITLDAALNELQSLIKRLEDRTLTYNEILYALKEVEATLGYVYETEKNPDYPF